jgi:hypothetical protein
MVFHTLPPTTYGNYLYLQMSDVYSGGDYCLGLNSYHWYVYKYDMAFRTYMQPDGRGARDAPAIHTQGHGILEGQSSVVIGIDKERESRSTADGSNTGQASENYLPIFPMVAALFAVTTAVGLGMLMRRRARPTYRKGRDKRFKQGTRGFGPRPSGPLSVSESPKRYDNDSVEMDV